MRANALPVLLATAMIIPPGCATRDRSSLSVTEGMTLTKAEVVEHGDLRIEHVVYRDVDRPENPAVAALLKQGLVPVMVRAENVGPTRVRITPEEFALRDDDGPLEYVQPGDLPYKIDSDDGSVVTVNQTRANRVALTIFAVIFFVVLIAALDGKGGGPNYVGGFSEGGSDPSVTMIDYEKSFFTAKRVKPGHQVQGLLFFRTTDGREPNWQTLKLTRDPSP